jgi:hypothetical protein
LAADRKKKYKFVRVLGILFTFLVGFLVFNWKRCF